MIACLHAYSIFNFLINIINSFEATFLIHSFQKQLRIPNVNVTNISPDPDRCLNKKRRHNE